MLKFKLLIELISVLNVLCAVTACLQCFIENDYFSTPELIDKSGYPLEIHEIETEDGYLLTLHRIPYGKTYRNTTNSRIVLLQHGVLCSSAYFVQVGANKSLGFLLADAGFDVWMANSRGNCYSRNHTRLDPDKDNEFWDFSLETLAVIDLPNTIDYILDYTKKEKVSLIGHSQGCTLFYILTSMMPEYNKKIDVHISLGPVVYLKHLGANQYKYFSSFTNILDTVAYFSGVNEIFPQQDYSEVVYKMFFHGYGRPAGSSRKVITHYGHLVQTGNFVRYDYGKKQNLMLYGRPKPPEYGIKNVTADVWIFHIINDWIATRKDVKRLVRKLKNANRYTVFIDDENFTHMDFIYGEHIVDLVYNKIIKILKLY